MNEKFDSDGSYCTYSLLLNTFINNFIIEENFSEDINEEPIKKYNSHLPNKPNDFRY